MWPQCTGPYVIRHSTNADYLSNLAAGPLDEYHLVEFLNRCSCRKELWRGLYSCREKIWWSCISLSDVYPELFYISNIKGVRKLVTQLWFKILSAYLALLQNPLNHLWRKVWEFFLCIPLVATVQPKFLWFWFKTVFHKFSSSIFPLTRKWQNYWKWYMNLWKGLKCLKIVCFNPVYWVV